MHLESETDSVKDVTMRPGDARDRRSLFCYTRESHREVLVDDTSSLDVLYDNAATLPPNTAQMVTSSKLGDLRARKRFLCSRENRHLASGERPTFRVRKYRFWAAGGSDYLVLKIAFSPSFISPRYVNPRFSLPAACSCQGISI